MSAAQALGAVAAIVMAAGLVLVIRGIRGSRLPLARDAASLPRPGPRLLRGLGATGAGVLAWLLTGWPAVGVGLTAAIVGLPAILRSGAHEQDRIVRVEGVEEWARRVADILAIGVGLEQAIQTASRTAPSSIAGQCHTLAARLAARMPTEEALRRFADALSDPTADLVVAALILAARRRGPGVAAALTAIADSAGEEVGARRRIESDRAKPRATARAVTIITVTVIGVGLLNRGYTDPYSSAVGQLVLLATLGFFAAALWWMNSMTRPAPRTRILAGAQEVDR